MRKADQSYQAGLHTGLSTERIRSWGVGEDSAPFPPPPAKQNTVEVTSLRWYSVQCTCIGSEISYLLVMTLELTNLSCPSSCCSLTVIGPTGERSLQKEDGTGNDSHTLGTHIHIHTPHSHSLTHTHTHTRTRSLTHTHTHTCIYMYMYTYHSNTLSLSYRGKYS